jgi:hypothetical protein
MQKLHRIFPSDNGAHSEAIVGQAPRLPSFGRDVSPKRPLVFHLHLPINFHLHFFLFLFLKSVSES